MTTRTRSACCRMQTASSFGSFTKRGTFEFACLIPGHYEKGMFGKIIVK